MASNRKRGQSLSWAVALTAEEEEERVILIIGYIFFNGPPL
jgi:hypothetical protein